MSYISERRYKIKLIEPLLGTIPKNKEIFRRFVLNKYYYDDEDEKELAEELETQADQEMKTAPNGEGETGFHTDADGVYLLDYQIKGFLKHAANVLKKNLKIRALRSKVADYVFIEPRYIWIAEKIAGTIQRPLPGMTMQGPRSSLISSDYVEAGIEFEIKITLFEHPEVDWEVIEELLNYGRWQGLGQWRGAGYGRFVWERVDNVEEEQPAATVDKVARIKGVAA